MKLVAFLLSLISVSYAFEDHCRGAYLQSVHKKCMLAHGGSTTVVENFKRFDKIDDENTKCFLDCIMRECKYFDDDGKLNADVPQRLSWALNGDKESNMKPIEEAAARCAKSQIYGTSKCDNAAQFGNCLREQSPVKLKLSKINKL